MWTWTYALLKGIVDYVSGLATPPANPLGGGAATANVALCSGAMPTDATPTWTEFTEASFSGYGRAQTSTNAYSANADGTPGFVSNSLTFTNTAAFPAVVTGVVLVDTLTGTPTNIWGYYTLDDPIVVPAGGTVSVLVGYPQRAVVVV